MPGHMSQTKRQELWGGLRPKADSPHKAEHTITVRMSRKAFARLQLAASRNGFSVNAYCVDRLMESATKDLGSTQDTSQEDSA